ncbi:MAG: TIM44-like domain-containing protein [Clostridia bacterium]|nr:TIM44-like domain-containing protein [Clostridia bacterium]
MKKSFFIFLSLILSTALIFAVSITSLADFGDFSGDTDWGGSSFGGSSWDSDWDDDWSSSSNSNYYTGSTSSSDNDDSGIGLLPVVVVVAIVLIIVFGRKGKGTTPSAPTVNVQVSQTPVTHTMAELKLQDPDFSEEALKEKISNLYVQLQNGWQAKDLSSLQNTMTDAFYNQMDRQLQAYKLANQTNKIERIAVLGVQLMGYNEDDTNTTVVAKLDTRIVDYVVDDNTGAVIRGSQTAEKFMTYEWTLVRAKGVKTGTQADGSTVRCPSCGAPMNINYSAKCEFCGSVVKSNDYDWALSGMKGLSQRTNG